MDFLSNFGENLSDMISDAKITSEQFAQSINIDVSVVYRYLRKECVPTLTNAVKIADYFKCSLSFLFGLSHDNPEINYKQTPPFSDRFKGLLAEKGYTRYRLCKEARFSDQCVDDWYHGKRIPTIESLIKLAKFFDCALDYLIGRD